MQSSHRGHRVDDMVTVTSMVGGHWNEESAGCRMALAAMIQHQEVFGPGDLLATTQLPIVESLLFAFAILTSLINSRERVRGSVAKHAYQQRYVSSLPIARTACGLWTWWAVGMMHANINIQNNCSTETHQSYRFNE